MQAPNPVYPSHLKLFQCDNSKIGAYAKLVDDRNETARPNGNIFYSTQASLDQKITEIMRVVDEIQTHSTSVIQRCYENFLASSYDDEERKYPDATDQIREVLVHGHYLSQKDIEICLAYEPSLLMSPSLMLFRLNPSLTLRVMINRNPKR